MIAEPPPTTAGLDASIELSWRDHTTKQARANHVHERSRIISQLAKYERGIINPRTSKWVPLWDTATFMCLMFTAIITPFEVCIIQEPGVIWSVVNWVVNSFFIADMVLQFFLAYQESPKKGARWIVHRPAIIRHYLRTWFFLDLLSSIDFQLVGKAILSSYETAGSSSGGDGGGGEDGTDMLRLIRGIRLVRLVKLLRILRASRIIARWQNFIGMSFAQLSMIKFAVMTVFLVHILACFWAYTGINWKRDDDDLEHETTWVIAGQFEPWIENSPISIYTVSFYVAVVAMFGGVGSIVPHNYYEYMVLTIMMVLGSFVWAWVIGSLCGILATLNPHATNFRNTMDELNWFMTESGFTQPHRVRLREFFRQTEDFSRTVAYNELLEKMSAQLRGDTALLMGEEVLRNVWYLHSDHVEKEFLAVVALNMQHAVYEARELIPVQDLTVLIKGMTAMRLRIITKGGVFGDDCIIDARHAGLRDLVKVNCLTFVQVVFIPRHTIFELVESFPAAKSWLDHASKILTFRAGLRKYYAAYKRELRRQREAARGGGAGGGPGRLEAMSAKHIGKMVRRQSLDSLQRSAGLQYVPEQDSVQMGLPLGAGGGGGAMMRGQVGQVIPEEVALETERASAAIIFADLMHQKRMTTLFGAGGGGGAAAREEETKDTRLQRSMSIMAERVENTRSAAADTAGRLETLARQQQLLDQKMELQLTMMTQLVAANEKRDKLLAERNGERASATGRAGGGGGGTGGYESSGTDTNSGATPPSKQRVVKQHTRRVKKSHLAVAAAVAPNAASSRPEALPAAAATAVADGSFLMGADVQNLEA